MHKKSFADSLVDFVRRKPYLAYTLAFGITSILAFFSFAHYRKSFVTNEDGLWQDFTALMYYGTWLRSIAKNVLAGKGLVIPLWEHSLGYGGDVITTLEPVVMGDPLNLLSAIVPARYTEYLFDLLVLVRFYLAGLSFTLFCRSREKDKVGTLAASIVYTFCGWAIYAGTTHPMYTYPLICLPLLLYGVDRLLARENPLPFVFAMCLSALTCLPFALTLIITLILYALGRFFSQYHENMSREFFSFVAQFLAFGCIGVALSGVLLCPVVSAMLNLPYTLDTTKEILYAGSYYRQFFAAFISSDVDIISWRVLAYSSPVLLSVFALFLHRGKPALKYALAALTLFLLFAAFGNALNGFEHPTNQWSWVVAIVIAYTLAEEWEEIVRANRRSRNLYVGAILCFLLLATIASAGRTTGFYASLSLVFVALCLMLLAGDDNREEYVQNYLQVALVGLLMVGVATNAYFHFDVMQRDHIDEYVHLLKCYKKAYNKTDKKLAKLTTSDEFCRFDRQSTHIMNTALNTGGYTIESYWGFVNPRLAQFLGEMEMGGTWLPNRCSNLDGRIFLEKLSSTGYYLADAEGEEPFGYDFVQAYGSHAIYEDPNALPLGYTYDQYLTRSVYEKLSVYAKQETLMQAVVVEDESKRALSDIDRLTVINSHASTHKVSIDCDKAIYRPDKTTYSVKEDGATVTLTFDGQPQCETYLHITGFRATPKPLYDLYFDKYDKQLSAKSFRKLERTQRQELKDEQVRFNEEANSIVTVPVTAGERTTEFSYTTTYCTNAKGQADYLVNLGYSEEGLHEVTLTFPMVGAYVIKGVEVVCQPMDQLDSYTNALKEDALKDVQIDTNRVSGTVKVDDNEFLCLTIPYSEGWKATVDGKETDLLVANTMFMGLPLAKGAHEVVLTYRTPGLNAGLLLSAAGCAGIVAIVLVRRAGRKNE